MGLSTQEKKFKIDFQDGNCGNHLGFPIGTILAILDLPVIPALPTKFRVNWPFRSGAEAINRFSRWPPWLPYWIGFLIRTILAIFNLQIIPKLPRQVGVNWPFDSGKEVKNRFSKWLPWRPSWISN